MNNPIPYSSLFYAPKSLVELDEMIRQLPESDRGLVYRFTMHAFNLAHNLTEQANEVTS